MSKRYGHFYNSIKIAIFKTVRSVDTTWNFARSITRVFHMNTSIENIVCVHRVHWKESFRVHTIWKPSDSLKMCGGCACGPRRLQNHSHNQSPYQCLLEGSHIMWDCTSVQQHCSPSSTVRLNICLQPSVHSGSACLKKIKQAWLDYRVPASASVRISLSAGAAEWLYNHRFTYND